MTNSIGPLVAADEQFCHQITDTFAVVSSADHSWTEKVCAMAAARDGSLQVGFGLGKYPNRDVMDGYGGVSQGVSQTTVRASRRLSPTPEATVIGPVRYEVVEPLKSVRFSLDENDAQPIAFDWLFECTVPPFLEDRTFHRSSSGYRVSADLVRYHQTGVASGWVSVDGEKTSIDPDTWVSTRDHSWGVRYDVGQPLSDVEPAMDLATIPGFSFQMIWCPVYMERPDGSRYALFLHYQLHAGHGVSNKTVMGGVEHPDGTFEGWTDLVPALSFAPGNRRLEGGTILARTASGERPLTIEVVSDTGFHLGAGMYFGFDGHHHGEFRGELHVSGERIPDCTTPAAARRLHQIRDTVIHVVDPVGGGEGWGNCQPIVTGGDDSFW